MKSEKSICLVIRILHSSLLAFAFDLYIMNNGKIISDPIYGFINIPQGLLLDIIEHPLMQRLTRIRQLGLTSMVYPSAQHTRFQHSLGAFHLMSETMTTLAQKGVFIFDSEAEATCAAILMHDIGHGPFSHILEHTLIKGISHEKISLLMMEHINEEMDGRLNLALKVFKNEYPKKFLHQLISSQLDMDRLDYLRRDSFFTGVAEGNIGSARIIKMLNVENDCLVVDAKGLYTIENYLMSRRLMYWQVYLHKTTVASEKVLIGALQRAKHLAGTGHEVFATPCLRFFLYNDIDAETFSNSREAQLNFATLDDNDVWSSLKVWTGSDDKVLAILAKDIVNRTLFKTEITDTAATPEHIGQIRRSLADRYNISYEDAAYLMSHGVIQKDMYDIDDDRIAMLYKDGTVKDISEASEVFNVAMLSKKIQKHYLCYQR